MNKFKLITILTPTTMAPFAWTDVSVTGTLISDYLFRLFLISTKPTSIEINFGGKVTNHAK